MAQRINSLGQPIGEALPRWEPARRPDGRRLEGIYCDVTAVTKAHAAALHEAYGDDTEHRMWTYMSDGPFPSVAALEEWIDAMAHAEDQVCHAIIDKNSGKAAGVASYLRIQPASGVIEVGGIAYSPRLQKTRAATEAMYLLMRHAFEELGYRRYEWKCDALNAASRNAAKRLGFAYDGLFRQAIVYRGRNRDTAWYSILDGDWPGLKSAFEAWLDPGNFNADGRQRTRLADLIADVRGTVEA